MCLGSFRGENLESFGRELWPKEESNFWQALSVEGFLRTIWYFLKSNFYPGPAIPCILGNVEKWISFIHEFFLWHWVRMPWWFRWPARIFCAWNFPGKKYWSGLPFPSPGDLPNPGIKPTSLVSSALAGIFFTTAPLGKPILTCCCCCCC